MRAQRKRGKKDAVFVSVALVSLLASMRAVGAPVEEPTYVSPRLVTKKEDQEGKKKDEKEEKKKQGWIPTIKAGFNFSMTQARNVIGVTDGMTVALGLQLDTGLTFRRGDHEWITSLEILQTHTKVPNIDPFVKSADELDLESIYLYHIKGIKWLGAYGGIRLTLPLFAGNLVPEEDTTVALVHTDDTVTQETAVAQEYYRLTDPGFPLIFRQFIGVAFFPVDETYLRMDVRVGTGAMEVWTGSSYIQDDDEDTADVLELRELEDFVQGGVEAHLTATGVVVKDVLSYSLKAGVMYPYVTTIDTDLTGMDLLNSEISFKLNVKLAEWASLNYSLSMVRIPLILPEWQITNNVMLSLTASYER
jgi:hypothetical protein